MPWEDAGYSYPGNFASPLEIAVEASNGASDYGNKFGEPVLGGFARSFGLTLSNRKRYEYVKPIMFSAGIGTIDSLHVKKQVCEKGELGVVIVEFTYSSLDRCLFPTSYINTYV